MGFWSDIWYSGKQQVERAEARLEATLTAHADLHKRLDAMAEEIDWRKSVEDSLRDELKEVGRILTGREKLLTDVLVAVGRVKVFDGQPISSFALLPELVSMVVSDHEDLEGRIDAVVAYLRHLGPMEGESETIRQDVGKLLQGAPPEIIDLQDKEE